MHSCDDIFYDWKQDNFFLFFLYLSPFYHCKSEGYANGFARLSLQCKILQWENLLICATRRCYKWAIASKFFLILSGAQVCFSDDYLESWTCHFALLLVFFGYLLWLIEWSSDGCLILIHLITETPEIPGQYNLTQVSCWEWDNTHPCILSWCHGLVTGTNNSPP